MFFFLSKLTYIFITPFNWLLALLAWWFFAKKPTTKKRLIVVIILFVLFFGNDVLYTTLVNAWQPKPVTIPPDKTYEAGIVLGGLSSFDKHGNGFLNSAANRLTETCILYHTGKIKKIIVSGGAVYSDRPKEAPFLFRKLTELGVPARDIIIEQQSRTTFENATYTKRIVDSINIPGPFVLVTSAMHLPRSERVFAKAGLSVTGFPSNYSVLEKKFYFEDYVIPKLYVISDWGGFLKEVIGLWGYTLFNKA
jgi:uncharacterized SAM-binding protein YcdF (DUF218 family)